MANYIAGTVTWKSEFDLGALKKGIAEANTLLGNFNKQLGSALGGKSLFSKTSDGLKKMTSDMKKVGDAGSRSIGSIGKAAIIGDKAFSSLGSNLGKIAVTGNNAFASLGRSIGKVSLGGTASLNGFTNSVNNAGAGAQSASVANDKNAMSVGRMTQAVASGTALYQGFLAALQSSTAFLGDSVRAANQYQAALLGLNSVAGAFGQDQEKANQAAKNLASDGLLTVSDAAVGLKNLLATGFSLDQAIVLMDRFKDSAAFGRQSALGFGESIRGATEGIKNGNSILTDNAGVTKNLSVILREAGKSEQDVMNITTDASVRQALFTGLVRETAAQVGDAAKLSDTYAGAQARAAAQTETFKQGLGAVIQALTGGLLGGFTSLIGSNQQLIISLGAAGIGVGLFGSALFLGIKAMRAFQIASVLAAATNPWLLLATVIGAVMGVILFKTFDNLQGKLGETNKSLTDSSDKTNLLENQTKKLTKAQQDLAEKLGDIDKQIAKNRRDFQEQLADIVKTHKEKVKELEKQLADEDKSFNKSFIEREKDFKDSQAEMTKTHHDRLISLQQQLDQELATNRNVNSLKVKDLMQSIEKEKQAFAKQSAEKQKQYNDDVSEAKTSYQERVSEAKLKLDEEKAFLEKHAADVSAVRNVILLDEIDKIKRSNEEQLQSLEKQKQQAIQKTGETNDALLDETDKFLKELQSKSGLTKGIGSEMGRMLGDAFKEELKKLFTEDIPKAFKKFATDPKTYFDIITRSTPGVSQYRAAYDFFDGFRATGGPVSAGKTYGVGEKGPEMFVPKTSGYILPNDLTKEVVSNKATTSDKGRFEQNNTFNVYNQIDMTRGLRDLAWQLGN